MLRVLVLLAACSAPVRPAPPAPCVLPEPEVVARDGAAVLERWDLPAAGPWFEPGLPDDPRYAAFRDAIRQAGAELARPIHDPPAARTDDERELWRREHHNAAVAAPFVRPIRCLEAALFARQHARYDELAHPTEFVAQILRRGDRLRVYMGAGDQLFPPKRVYGFDEARADRAAGWRVIANLHNHTVVERAGRPALGTPAPSTNDVHLLRNVALDLALERIWVTNGAFTADLPIAELPRFEAR